MSNDIVDKLVYIKEQGQCDCHICDTAMEGANEITQLRNLLDELWAYAAHERGCPTVAPGNVFGPIRACTCGLDDLLIRLEECRD